ncbi:MAG: hypothetical protein JW814_00710 [Candidatus Krumholzibacteriota bacterium]|nr:hypothetical protein [Candidatus Krumholzibacteriota bacterium]
MIRPVRRRFAGGYLLFLCLAILSTGLYAGDAEITENKASLERSGEYEAARILAFGDFLLGRGEYYRAITEYYRTIHLLSDRSSDLSLKASVGIGRAYYLGSDFIRAGDWLFAIRREILSSGSNEDRDLLFHSLILGARTREALEILGEYDGEGRFFFAGMAYAAEMDWKEAAGSFLRVPPSDLYHDSSVYNTGVCESALAAGSKSPAVAGFLAIVPGAGYLYAGHKRSAFASLLVNSLFIAASIQAFDHEEYFLGGFLTAIGSTWYAGNIKGSVDSAGRYNRIVGRRYFTGLSLKKDLPESHGD